MGSTNGTLLMSALLGLAGTLAHAQDCPNDEGGDCCTETCAFKSPVDTCGTKGEGYCSNGLCVTSGAACTALGLTVNASHD